MSPRERMLAAVRCPRCGEALVGGPVVSCAAGHPVRGAEGWLDLSSPTADEVTGRTFESFGYEWTAFADIQLEDEGYWEKYTADVPWDGLRDALGVDIGCGKGRYSRFTARRLGGLVALDGSDAVSAAARNLGVEPNVLVVRADLREPALAEARFDFVSCLGVLHHLADPEEGFRRIVRLLAPGGILLVFLYSRPERRGARAVGLGAATALRKVTVRAPHRVLRPLCLPLAAALYATVVVPGAIGDRRGVKALASLPLAAYRGSPVRTLWLDTFDRLSAPIEHRFSWEEVRPWFDATALDVLAVRRWGGLIITARNRP